MSEYWKSNPRKFCEFCKCWIADNRPSVDFHERGKKHKENVEKRLDIIAKQGKEDYNNKLKEDDYMKAMEKAALIAYKKDLQTNPDMMGTKIAEMAQARNAEIVIGSQECSKDNYKTAKKEICWHEVKAPDGSSYYWHTKNGASSWEAPKEGFISLEEQKKLTKGPKTNGKDTEKPSKKSKKKFHPKKPSPPIQYGPAPRGQPYGTWKAALEPVKELDLQLPFLPEPEYVAPELVLKRPKITFAEKEVTLAKEIFTSNEPVFFKKRKGTDESKRNVRKRIDD